MLIIFFHYLPASMSESVVVYHGAMGIGVGEVYTCCSGKYPTMHFASFSMSTLIPADTLSTMLRSIVSTHSFSSCFVIVLFFYCFIAFLKSLINFSMSFTSMSISCRWQSHSTALSTNTLDAAPSICFLLTRKSLMFLPQAEKYSL